METQNIGTDKIVEIYKKNANRVFAIRMESYMKKHFSFLGIPKSLRADISKEFLQGKSKSKEIDWEFVFHMFDLPYREYQYLALEYLRKLEKNLQKSDIELIEKLILTKSWWDSVDSLAPLVGVLCQKYPELKKEILEKWILNSNIWLKRVTIIFQLKYKNETDTEFLSKAILSNNLSKEFFVNKAIGWSLRQYSKYNADWVKVFISRHSLAPLSVREGSKYL
ncbi:DNA alkylation repair protein [Labilibaculum antarcticum]|uniref:DNA alkylation repair protein n=1 Tax=Labilibaculum antarcticum TaxID=1717717 RepID=A0A1Y1CQ16_9BACT|nr:DNA alkylation repair protein [Labilibaculum antarcticum]BAX82559.1 DNA alkylation repair protein [Labilibaculum antarcticum]